MSEHRQLAGPIDALDFLLRQWTTEIHLPERGAHALVVMWQELARALTGSRAAFDDELMSEAGTPRWGRPPLQSLGSRLDQLTQGGLHDIFLAVAVRGAMDRLIWQHVPAGYVRWRQLADEYLPLDLQFGYREDEVPSGSFTYTFGPSNLSETGKSGPARDPGDMGTASSGEPPGTGVARCTGCALPVAVDQALHAAVTRPDGAVVAHFLHAECAGSFLRQLSPPASGAEATGSQADR